MESTKWGVRNSFSDRGVSSSIRSRWQQIHSWVKTWRSGKQGRGGWWLSRPGHHFTAIIAPAGSTNCGPPSLPSLLGSHEKPNQPKDNQGLSVNRRNDLCFSAGLIGWRARPGYLHEAGCVHAARVPDILTLLTQASLVLTGAAPWFLRHQRSNKPHLQQEIQGNEDTLMLQLSAACCSHANCTLWTRVTRVPFPTQHGVGDLLNCKMKL